LVFRFVENFSTILTTFRRYGKLFFKKIIFTDFYKASLENHSSFQLCGAVYKITSMIFVIWDKFLPVAIFFSASYHKISVKRVFY